jgi:hypothetical protein
MDALEKRNKYNTEYVKQPTTIQLIIAWSNQTYGRNDKTMTAVRNFHNRTGDDFRDNAEAVQALGLRKIIMENDARRLQREDAKEKKRLYDEEQARLREEQRIRREARRLRNEARQVKREEKMLRRIERANRKAVKKGEGKYTYKSQYGNTTQLGARLYVDGINLQFTTDTFGDLTRIINRLLRDLPEGFRFSIRLDGDIVRYTNEGVEVEIPNDTIAITRVGDNLDYHLEELMNHKRIEMPSDRVAIIKTVNIFFEQNQGGSFTTEGFDELKALLPKHKVISPKSKKNCGQVCLKLYKADTDEKGFLPLAYMVSRSPVPVVDNIDDVGDECILLYDNHYYIVKSLELLKVQRAEKSKATRAITKAVKKSLEVLVYDIETTNKKVGDNIEQLPVMLSFTQDGETATTFYGLDCADRFVQYLLDNPEIKNVYGFNAGNYDHILIRNSLIRAGMSLEECRRSVNSIIRIKALVCGRANPKATNGYNKPREIIFGDLINYTTGTLAQNLDALGLKPKGTFDYNLINENMTGDDLMKLTEYCEWDTMGAYKLYESLRDPLAKLGLDINELFTLSQGAFKLLKKTWHKTMMADFRQPKFLDDIGRKASIGGRTEVFKHFFKSDQYDAVKDGTVQYDELDDYLKYLDVVSLYPSAMANNPYPVGKAVQVGYLGWNYIGENDEGAEEFYGKYEIDNGHLGIYQCNIRKPKDIKFPVVYSKKEHSYNLNDSSGEWHTNIDIDEMIRFGYQVEIMNGVNWGCGEHIFKKYINEMFERKNKAPKGTPEYSNAKLMINAVFGKTLQNDDHVEYFVIKNKDDLVKMYKGRELARFTMEWDFTGGEETGYYTYTTPNNIKGMTSKMGHIGAFILSYSKKVIYEQLAKTDAYYMDTDSLFVHRTDAENIPQGKALGEFADDLDGGRIIKAIFISKKMYYLEYIMPDGSIRVKSTGKGVQRKAIKLEHYEAMLRDEVVGIKKDFQPKRNVKEGKILFTSPVKQIKMNSGGRIFIGLNTSLPLGHYELIRK